ncbi:MAG TPA: Asp-tRNA(Asn)/Glu-tRNA(Gln) amidotransferase subunit GatC [Verrucomicrobiae bacterium]|nr:Asp-tRNA(Asn)/Glu-tRNA(Gln) amidotransferase subunit GatC [Verrucomicrobiae bacterium]
MKISREDVKKVADLAHLGLSPAEIDQYREQLDAILTYVDKLKELDVSAVEPMAQVLHGAPGSSTQDEHPELREDALQPCEVARPVLAQAADSEGRFFRVPRVIDR